MRSLCQCRLRLLALLRHRRSLLLDARRAFRRRRSFAFRDFAQFHLRMQLPLALQPRRLRLRSDLFRLRPHPRLLRQCALSRQLRLAPRQQLFFLCSARMRRVFSFGFGLCAL